MTPVMTPNTLAIDGGNPVVDITPPTWPITGEQEIAWMTDVVKSGKWSWIGPHERAFCEEYRNFIGTDYCLCLANGTVTLQCALQAVGVEPGDEVIVPALTWVATAQAAMDIGANVVLVDIDAQTLCIDPTAIENAITPKTKAIIPVHLYGCMADMDAIMKIAKKHDLKVVEDVAHQHGSRWRDTGAGAIGDAGSFSFQQSKVLTSGEGGAITCNDPEIYKTAFALKQVGWTPNDPTEDHFENLVQGNRYGHNYRMTEMQAVLLRCGLSRIEDQVTLREKNAARITARLLEMGGPLQAVPRDERVTRQSYYAMTFTFDADQAAGASRGDYKNALAKEKAPFVLTYDPVYSSSLLNLKDTTSPIPYRDPSLVQDYASLCLPNTEKAFRETALLLMHHHLLGEDTYTDQLLDAIDKVN